MVGRDVLHYLCKKLFTMQLAIWSTGQRQGIYHQERFRIQTLADFVPPKGTEEISK